MAAGLAVTVTMLAARIVLVLHQSWVYLWRGFRVPAWAPRTWAGPVPPAMHGHDGG